MNESSQQNLIDGAKIIRDIRASESGSFEVLYDYFSRSARFLFFRDLRPEDVEDAMHDAFVDVVDAIRHDRIAEPERLPGFIRTVCRRKAIQVIGRYARDRSSSEPVEGVAKQVAGSQYLETLNRERRELAARVLNALSPTERTLLVRFFILGHTAEKICRDLTLSENQFRVGKSRAKKRFIDLMSNRLSKTVN